MKKFLFAFVVLGNIFFDYCFGRVVIKKTVHPMYIVTACDSRFYKKLINLIGSIHSVNFNELGEIAVFDLGLTKQQCKKLGRIQKLHVYPVKMINPYLLTLFNTSPSGYLVRGWYAWKPVVIKQALEKWPYILYMDAGATVLKPLDKLFEYIRKNDYFLVDMTAHCIRVATPKFAIENILLTDQERAFIFADTTYCVSGGLQGLSRSMLSCYVLPIYELVKDLRFFADDGSAEHGFGRARHDQVIFSIYARKLKLQTFFAHEVNNNDIYKTQYFNIDGNQIPFKVTPEKKFIDKDTIIYQSRDDIEKFNYYKKFIKHKKFEHKK